MSHTVQRLPSLKIGGVGQEIRKDLSISLENWDYRWVWCYRVKECTLERIGKVTPIAAQII